MSQGPHDSHDMGKHALIMVLCCLIPLVALGILWLTGFSSSILSTLIPLLCPLLMLLFMGLFMKKSKKADSETQEGPSENHGHCGK